MIKNIIIVLLAFALGSSSYAQLPLTKTIADKVLSDSSWPINRYVRQRKISYIDATGKKVVVMVLKARLKKRRIALEAATPDNKDGFGRQVVPKEMKMENSQGHRVIAGVNADFFNMKNGTPLGPVVKEGRIIRGAEKGMNSFVGITTSGNIIIGDSLLFVRDRNRLKEALGARPVLIKNGKCLVQDTGSFSTIHHPRTAFGVIGKRTVLLVTVDGRQPDISNGISLTDLAALMRFLGADNAVNLDGGGSTTMVVSDPQTATYKVVNSPSGKALRPVANSWILINKRPD